MSLGNFKAVHQDVLFKIKANEQLSPEPPYVNIRKTGDPLWGSNLSPVVEDTDSDSILYNEFKYQWETTGQDLGSYDIRTGDTDLAGNPGETSDTFVLHASHNYWYNYEYNWG